MVPEHLVERQVREVLPAWVGQDKTGVGGARAEA